MVQTQTLSEWCNTITLALTNYLTPLNLKITSSLQYKTIIEMHIEGLKHLTVCTGKAVHQVVNYLL